MKCPECGKDVATDAFQCPSCELLLGLVPLDSIEPPREPTVIRMMLSPPEASLSRADIRVPDEVRQAAKARLKREVTAPTVLMTFAASSTDVPAVADGLDLTSLSLSSFEAFVISLMDGRTNVDGVRQAAGLSKPEMNGLLMSLLDKKVVRVSEPPKAPARPPRPVKAEDLGLVLEAVQTEPENALPAPPPSPPPLPPSEIVVRPAATATPPPMPALRRLGGKPPAPPPPPARPAPKPDVADKPVRTTPAIEAFLKQAKSAQKPREEPPASAAMLDPLQRAIALEKEGQMDRAIEVLEQAIKKSRNPAPLYNRLGIVLLKERRDLGRAEMFLEKARKLDPSNAVYEKNYFTVMGMRAAVTHIKKNPLLKGR
ncbi:MAG: tetratricopeptide repeat protein [Deltaproteobacteria bacterium]|nr:tetratricopeptide repeat protein [Deltaproteobacteria bacterium]